MAETLLERFRKLTGEVIPDDGSEEDTFFTDVAISEIFVRNNNDLYASVAEGWDLKASDFASLIDISEGGSSRRLSQMYDHAIRQRNYWQRVAGIVVGGTGASGVVARSAQIAREQVGPASPPPPTPEALSASQRSPGATLTARDTWSPDGVV